MKALGRLRQAPQQQQPSNTDESPLGTATKIFKNSQVGSILSEMSKMNLKFGRLKVKPLFPPKLIYSKNNS
jgi:hypothetical protein